jgi:hypothetical protein
MRRSVKQRAVATAAVTALLAGGGIAAVSATGQSTLRRHTAARHGLRTRARELAAAAVYLGVSPSQLEGELSGGKTLAQVADATAGKSAAGLTQALVATGRAKLATASAKLPRRVAAELNRPGGPAGAARRAGGRRATGASRIAALFARPTATGAVAAAYLGVATSQLRAELTSGKTLAQVADATAGKSQGGLVVALVAAKRAKIAAAAAAGRLTPARQAKRLATLDKRVAALVQRQFAGG